MSGAVGRDDGIALRGERGSVRGALRRGLRALAGNLTDESSTEQSSAGLGSCTAEELERFQTLNAAYRERFGFPFVMAVRGRDRAAILEAFELRLGNDADTEFATALREIDRIAMLRLEALTDRD